MIEKIISEQLHPRAQELVDRYKVKTLIMLGGAECVWRDFQNFTHGNHNSDWHVMCVNDVGMFFPEEVEHWFSLHAEQLYPWQQVREFHFTPAKHLHGTMDKHSAVIPWPVPSIGTSGLAGVYVGLCLGYDQIVLCGFPLDDTPQFHGPHWVKRNFTNEARHDVWETANRKIFEGKVKSMSGVSREILGAP